MNPIMPATEPKNPRDNNVILTHTTPAVNGGRNERVQVYSPNGNVLLKDVPDYHWIIDAAWCPGVEATLSFYQEDQLLTCGFPSEVKDVIGNHEGDLVVLCDCAFTLVAHLEAISSKNLLEQYVQ